MSCARGQACVGWPCAARPEGRIAQTASRIGNPGNLPSSCGPDLDKDVTNPYKGMQYAWLATVSSLSNDDGINGSEPQSRGGRVCRGCVREGSNSATNDI